MSGSRSNKETEEEIEVDLDAAATAPDQEQNASITTPPTMDEAANAIASIRRNARPPSELILGENKVENWKNWRSRWDNYALLAALDKIPNNFQIAQLQNCLGDEALKALSGFQFSTAEEARTTKEILDAFDRYVIGQVNETLERYKFGKRNQEEGEGFNKYLADLRRKIKTCGYCVNCEPSILRDRIIHGILSDATREELLKEATLTLERCVDICAAGETAASHRNSMRSEAVHKVKPRKPKTGVCRYCATEHLFIKEECPAYGKKCSNCKERNHFEVCCKSKPARGGKKQDRKSKKTIHRVEALSSDSEAEESQPEFCNAVKTKQNKAKHRAREVKAKMLIGKKEVVFQVDTGATCNLLPQKHAKNIQPYYGTLMMWNSSSTQPLGKCRRVLKNPKTGKRYDVEFIVCKDDCQPLLGLSVSTQMKLITVDEEQFHRVAAINTQAFSEVFDEKLGTLPGTQKLRVKTEATPVVMANRRISVNMRPKLEEELKRLESMGVIQKITKPTPWVSQLVMTPKKDGSVRICIDPKELNKALQREHYSMPILEEVLHELRDSKVFSKADLSSGYWHVDLEEESRLLTAFQTPFGRFIWCRLPFGLSVSAEIFQKRLIEALEGLSGVVCIADDIVIHGRTQQEHDDNLKAFLCRCGDKGIKLNNQKLEKSLSRITFMGHMISEKGLEADPAKVEAITCMEPPRDLTELRRFMGMINYLAKFLPKLAEVMQPLHNLLKKDVPYCWSTSQQAAFDTVKSMITEAPVLAFYKPEGKLVLENDACEYGIGSVLLQGGQPVAYASRTLTETERRYAQIEKEMLAAVYGLEKFHHYTYAREVEVISDHKPLEAIAKKPLSKAPRRLQHLLLRARNYDYDITYKPGSQIPTADTLSRAPVGKPEGEEEVVHSVTIYPIKDGLMQEIRLATMDDPTLNALGEVIHRGWPNDKKDVPEVLLPFHSYRDELTVTDGVIMRSDRVVIPERMKKEMKKRVHTGHMGINSCLRLAKDVMFWPKMSTEIRQYVETCGTCATYSDQQPRETVVISDIPDKPWVKIATDLFSWGGDSYMILYDYFSNFIEVDQLKDSTTAGEIVKKLQCHFTRNGSPWVLVSDNGPQYTSAEFKQFCKEWNVNHETISPGNSQANGAAEAAVKTVKRIFRKCKASGDNPYKGLLNYYNTPTEGLTTCPAQRLLGRKTRTMLPTTDSRTPMQMQTFDAEGEQWSKELKRHKGNPGGTDLRPISCGDVVRMQPRDGLREWKEGTVVRPLTTRAYEVAVGDRTYVRNRRQLRATKKSSHSLPATATTPKRARPEAARVPDPVSEAETATTRTPPQLNLEEVPVEASASPVKRRSGRISRPPARLIAECGDAK